MNKSYSLHVEPRTAVGHAMSSLRSRGVVPAVVYGSGISSTALSVKTDQFLKTYDEAGETSVVVLDLEGKQLPVLIHTVQLHPVTQKVMHVEFLKVNLKEKMKTFVPVSIEGDAPAVKDGLGALLTVLQEVEIEALPTDIPESVVVNVSSLGEVGAEKRVGDLVVPTGVIVITDPEETVVKISALTVEKEPEKIEDAAEDAGVPVAELPDSEAKTVDN